MAFTDLKTDIATAIKANGNNEITGQLLQNVILTLVDQLVGNKGLYRGVANTATAPGTPDGVEFYFTSEAGAYPNFAATIVKPGQLILFSNETGVWIGTILFDGVNLLDTKASSKGLRIGSYHSATTGKVVTNSSYDGVTINVYSKKILLKTTLSYLPSICAYSGMPSQDTYLGDSNAYLEKSGSLITIKSDLVRYIHIIFVSSGGGGAPYDNVLIIQDAALLEVYTDVATAMLNAAESLNATVQLRNTRNMIENSRLMYLDKPECPTILRNQTGTPIFKSENNLFGTKQIKITATPGQRAQIRNPISFAANTDYSIGFFYKITSGTKAPSMSPYDYESVPGFVSAGTYRTEEFADGWKFAAREGVRFSQNTAILQFIIDYNNNSGTQTNVVLIALPTAVVGSKIPANVTHGYDFALKYIDSRIGGGDEPPAGVTGILRNNYIDSGFFQVNKLEHGVTTRNQDGVNEFNNERSDFAGRQIRITSPIGARAQLLQGFEVKAYQKYSFGFFYKIIQGTKTPSTSRYIFNEAIPGAISLGVSSVQIVGDGWSFFRMEDLEYSQDSSVSSGLYIDLDNRTGTTPSIVLIAMPILVESPTLDYMQVDGTIDSVNDAIKRIEALEISSSGAADWVGKRIVTYGDSITAFNNGTYTKPFPTSGNWGNIVADYLGMEKHYGRGVGGQRFVWNDNSFWINSLGEYRGRGKYNAAGTQTESELSFVAATPTDIANGKLKFGSDTELKRGAFASWGRIKSMIPAAERLSVDLVLVMGGTNDFNAVQASPTDEISGINRPQWSVANTIDNEWIADTTYSNGGDFLITSLYGGIASTVMKFQIWCPNAIIVLVTPPAGRASTDTYNPATNPSGYSTQDIAIHIEKIAQFMSVPSIDMYSLAGINQFNRAEFLSDAVHPDTAKGIRALAKGALSGIKQIMPYI